MLHHSIAADLRVALASCLTCALGADLLAGDHDIVVTGFEDSSNAWASVSFAADSNDRPNLSVLRAYGNTDALAPFLFTAACGVPDAFQGLSNTNYLQVNTGDGTLWSSLYGPASATKTGDPYSLATSVYCDMLVQFCASYDVTTPTLASDEAQFAIWLNEDGSQTNLCLYAGLLAADGSSTPTTFVFTNALPVVEGAWYRLTAEAVPDLTGTLSAFRFYLDGRLLKSAALGLSDDLVSTLRTNASPYLADAEAGAVFGSLRGCATGARASLTAIGFSGNGAVDDFQISEQMPQFVIEKAMDDAANAAAVPTSITNSADRANMATWIAVNEFLYSDLCASRYLGESYLLNAETLLEAQPSLKVTAITSVEDGWELTVEATANDALVSLANINGKLRLTAAANLADLDSSAPSVLVKEQDFTTDETGRATIKVNGDNSLFMKVSIGF